MITFLSLFLGIVTGVHTVELGVSETVAEVASSRWRRPLAGRNGRRGIDRTGGGPR